MCKQGRNYFLRLGNAPAECWRGGYDSRSRKMTCIWNSRSLDRILWPLGADQREDAELAGLVRGRIRGERAAPEPGGGVLVLRDPALIMMRLRLEQLGGAVRKEPGLHGHQPAWVAV